MCATPVGRPEDTAVDGGDGDDDASDNDTLGEISVDGLDCAGEEARVGVYRVDGDDFVVHVVDADVGDEEASVGGVGEDLEGENVTACGADE